MSAKRGIIVLTLSFLILYYNIERDCVPHRIFIVWTTVTRVAWVPVVATDSACGLPSTCFAKALIMFSGFIIPILAYFDTCSPRGKPGNISAESPALYIFFSCRSQSSTLTKVRSFE